MGSTERIRRDVEYYVAPEWTSGLPYRPQYWIKLAMHNTPIQRWTYPSIPDGFTIDIKRDDLTGGVLSGNKVRKLEFLLADAIQKGCSHVITYGAPGSNHCRAVAVAAKQLGFEVHLFLLSETIKKHEHVEFDGNLLLDGLCGASLHFAPGTTPYIKGIQPLKDQLVNEIRAQKESCYEIPAGGSNNVGLFGYIQCFQELLDQGIAGRYDDIVVTCGSAGTTAGLALSNYLTGSRFRIHAIQIRNSAKYTEEHIRCTFNEMGIKDINVDQVVDIIDGHYGEGYGKSTDAELDFIMDVSSKTGILLDPVYTGKAMKGLIQELTNNPGRFKGNRLLFIHTGGLFGFFGRVMKESIRQSSTIRNAVHVHAQVGNVANDDKDNIDGNRNHSKK